jgi:hypothetical protein
MILTGIPRNMKEKCYLGASDGNGTSGSIRQAAS